MEEEMSKRYAFRKYNGTSVSAATRREWAKRSITKLRERYDPAQDYDSFDIQSGDALVFAYRIGDTIQEVLDCRIIRSMEDIPISEERK